MHTVKGIATQAVRRLDRSGLRRKGFKGVHFHAELGLQKQVEFKAEIAAHVVFCNVTFHMCK